MSKRRGSAIYRAVLPIVAHPVKYQVATEALCSLAWLVPNGLHTSNALPGADENHQGIFPHLQKVNLWYYRA